MTDRKVTIVIPTFNGQRYLGTVLGALCRQTAPSNQYEVVVVNNNSTIDVLGGSDTKEAISNVLQSGISFRCIRETKQGLTYARSAGVSAAQSGLVCFLDDDNEPSAGYVAAGMAAFEDSSIGILVSCISPKYEVEPTPAVRRREAMFAINHKLGATPIRWSAEVFECPTLGAGLWIRKPLFEAIMLQFGSTFLPDRVGNLLTSGGDIELGILAGQLGYDRVYLPDLVITHHIPANRVSTKYVIRLIKGIVRSQETIKSKYRLAKKSLFYDLFRFFVALVLGWIIALLRQDSYKEYRFILAAAYARLLGPIVIKR